MLISSGLRAAQASVMRNTIVEMVARAGRLDVLLNNVHGEKEMHWVNGHPVSRLYRRAAFARSCSLQA